ncbi:MAG: hypothetical protein M1839_004398 [Geoglossum umbratile]|nr:MAG: hypothetical protein M1839_004398 [Geoglossum umbratile]
MSIVFLKNWLFGNGKVGLLHDARGEGYGATAVGMECGGNEGECCAQVGDVPDGHANCKGDAGRSGCKGDTGGDGEATDVDLEAQESEGLLPARPALERSLTSRCFDAGSESSSQTRAKRVDARVISDAIIGLSDGLTVPFALTAGLSTLGDVKVVIFGGLAELMAGAISMGLGGYLGAQSEA